MSSETEEVSEDLAAGASAVTVASNLPDGDQAQQNDGRSKRDQARESVTYGYSQTQRSRVKEAGAVKRIGVAVLVNEVTETQEDGTDVARPRSAQELAAIEDLVKSAIAFDAERGDVVTVESMRFAPEPQIGSEAEIGLIEQVLAHHMVELLQGVILAVVAVALGLFVVRPILASAASDAEPDGEAEENAAALVGPDGEPLAALNGDEAEGQAGALPTPEQAVGAGALATIDPAAATAGEAGPEEEEDAAIASIAEQLRLAVGERGDGKPRAAETLAPRAGGYGGEVMASTSRLFEAFETPPTIASAAPIKDPKQTAYERGHADGLAEGALAGRAQGIEEGRAEGVAAGREEGRAAGREEGRREAEHAHAAAVKALRAVLDKAVAERRDAEARLAAACADAFRAATAAVLPRIARRGLADEAAGAAREIAAAVKFDAAVLRAPEADLPALRAALAEAGLLEREEAPIDLIAGAADDTTIRLEWRDGLATFDPVSAAERVLAQLDAALAPSAAPQDPKTPA